jgi:hypothetical protein
LKLNEFQESKKIIDFLFKFDNHIPQTSFNVLFLIDGEGMWGLLIKISVQFINAKKGNLAIWLGSGTIKFLTAILELCFFKLLSRGDLGKLFVA